MKIEPYDHPAIEKKFILNSDEVDKVKNCHGSVIPIEGCIRRQINCSLRPYCLTASEIPVKLDIIET